MNKNIIENNKINIQNQNNIQETILINANNSELIQFQSQNQMQKLQIYFLKNKILDF